jgi:serine/threonine protein kinase
MDPVREAGVCSPTHNSGERSSSVLRVLEGYLEELERGGEPNPDALVAQHPEIADELRTYLQQLNLLHRATVGLRWPASAVASQEMPDAGRLGDFRLLREIGRGGMGIVYEAEQLSLGRHVALKILPLAAALNPRQLKRFKHEAEAAAGLQHPQIVPIYAIGCESGIHFYAMQHIDGQSLARFIADLRCQVGKEAAPKEEGSDIATPNGMDSLTRSPGPSTGKETSKTAPQAEASFFQTVARWGIQAAEALEHAHQCGIVHRDIKPANLLLDPSGKIWISDFGLARSLSEPGLTRSGDLLGTLRYMSPEQASARRGLTDQRSDIYSLGATLYEVLTLEPALPGEDQQEVLRQLSLEEPRPPRALNPALPVELETIVLTAMDRSPDCRYPTAQEFAEDLRRFLNDQPILARPPSRTQRLRKWARRHKAWVTAGIAAMAVAIVVLAVSIGLIWNAQRQTQAALEDARGKQSRAEQNLESANRALDNLLSLSNTLTVMPLDPTSQKTVQDLLKEVKNEYHKLDPLNSTARYYKALAYRRVGDIYQRLVQDAEAENAYREAGQLFRQLADDFPGRSEYRQEFALCERNLGRMQRVMDQLDEADGSLGRAQVLLEELERTGTEPAQNKKDLAGCYHEIGLNRSKRGHLMEAVASYRRGLEILGSPESRRDVDDSCERASNLQDLGTALVQMGQFAEAERDLRQALTLREQLAARFPRDYEHRYQLAAAYRSLTHLLLSTGRLDDAERAVKKALEILEQLAKDGPAIPNFQRDVAVGYENLASLLDRRGQAGPADQALSRAIALVEKLVHDYPEIPEFQHLLAVLLNNHGPYLIQSGRTSEAEGVYRRALELWNGLHKAGRLLPEDRRNQGACLQNLAGLLIGRKDLNQARQLLEQAIVLQQQALKADPQHALGQLYLQAHYLQLADVLRELGHIDEAAQAALELAALPVQSWDLAHRAAHLLAECADTEVKKNPPNRTYSDRAHEFFKLALAKSAGNAEARAQLAWYLAQQAPAALRDVHQAVALAEEATRWAPKSPAGWSALGSAHYRAGHWKASLEALTKAARLRGCDRGFDLFFQAMDHWQLGEQDKAKHCYDQACAWAGKNDPTNQELQALQREASAVLGRAVATSASSGSSRAGSGPEARVISV